MTPARDQRTGFSLASWNVHQGIHNDGGRNRIVEKCRELDADVLVLLEAWWFDDANADMTLELADELGYKLHQWAAPELTKPDDVHPWRVAVLTRVPATRLDDVVLPVQRSRGERRMVRVEIDDGGVSVAGGHLPGIHSLLRNPADWRRERAALRSVSAVNDVVVGDLNMWGPVVRRDSAQLRRAVLGRTWPSHRPHSQIDHLLVSPRVEVTHADVRDDMGSDHRAIRAVLTAE